MVVSLWMALRGSHFDEDFIRFLVLLWGLVIGYIFGKIAGRGQGSTLYSAIGHLKALLVLGATLVLLYLLFTGTHISRNGQGDRICLSLAAVISFYFGLKT